MSSLEHHLQTEIERSLSMDPSLPGIVATVLAPSSGFAWSGACGRVQFDGEPLRPEHAFRIASVTKVFTAATVLRLVEQGRLALQDRLVDRLGRRSVELLAAAGYAPERIGLFDLLTHTAGLPDHASSEAYARALQADPQRRWTRHEQIELAMQLGGPLAEPGRLFSYSDTGYLLLGESIERASGQPLPQAMRERLAFSRLGLDQTHFETLEAAPAGQPRAHQYIGAWDALQIDASCDLYGGGGLVSTTRELAVFLRALLRGELFERAQTLAMALMTPTVGFADGAFLHSALLRGRIWGGMPCWGHGGYWGMGAAYFPTHDLALAVSWGQAESAAHTAGTPEQAGLMDRLAALCAKGIGEQFGLRPVRQEQAAP
ncbi:serine hydrolase domain-containing protein [Roseateles violae]|uniref:Serine hydrolase domain-containing protein n=1 Tax=Roseateles violae TaxID=3058042 RepID=A0ABT8E018_9BURK|nr:serine hydrolase domain-containing protein [Pelomonas sp. PFR6]MDN3923208.1 serine hydrolase domain-containing protein [Pelomonas sp. PFR6]